MATGFFVTIVAGLIGTALACGLLTILAAVPVRYVWARRMRAGALYVAAELQGAPDEGTRARAGDWSAHFSMPAPELHAKNWLDPTEIGAAIDARARFFVNPAARLEGSVLRVELGPARRAIVPVAEIAALAAARPHDLRRRKSMARYINNQRRPAVLIALRRPREVLLDKLRIVSALLLEVDDPRTFLELLSRVSGVEPDCASLNLLQ